MLWYGRVLPDQRCTTQLESARTQGTLFDALGLSRAEFGGLRLSAFLVGSLSYNSHLQMVPEFAGNTPALADPGSTNFRFDKFGLRVAKTFAPWLSASASFEVESHRDRHSHGFDPAFGCPGPGPCMERFGAEAASTETNLDLFQVTAIAPLGNGLAFSLGRFDVPFGIERHDEPLLLTATPSEVFRFGRPQRMTGGQVSYPFAPWLDVNAWVVNRWESETTETDFNDNNRDKSFGARIGFTPLARQGLLNFGVGAFFGPEQDNNNSNQRWVIDFDATWSPLPRFLVAGEEERGTIRQQWGWQAEDEVYRFYLGRDEAGQLVAAVAFLTEFTIHGPVRVAVGLSPDGKVKDAKVVEVTEETLPWLKLLLDQNLTQDYVGRDSRGNFTLGGRFAGTQIESMPHFYGQIVASLIQQAAILFEVTILKRPGKV